MAVSDKDKIDSIGIDNKFGNVILTINDDSSWRDEYQHLTILQDKINSYLEFIDNGELYKNYPNAEGKRIERLINFKNGITPKCEAYLNRIRNKLVILGINVVYKIED